MKKDKTLSRRDFVRALGLLGLGAACAPAPALAAVGLTETRRLPGNRYKVSESRFLMGTFVAIAAVGPSRTMAEHAIGLAYEEIERLSAVLDRHRDDTPVSRLNAEGVLRDAPADLRRVVAGAQQYARLTNGAYDATVLPVVRLLKERANPAGRMDVDRAELRAALALVDSDAVRLSGRDIRLDRQGMGLTLDGMGKGYIVDRASEILSANGAPDHLINAGGDMRARGERAPGRPWTVAVEDPRGRGDYPAVVHLRDAAIATSGGYEARFDASGSHHHVIDPQTALSPTRSLGVSVVAPTVMQADALSTAVFVLPPAEGVRLVNGLTDTECLILGNTGATARSDNWNEAPLSRRHTLHHT